MPYFATDINYLSPPLKQEFVISNKPFINLSCSIVAYKIENSKHDMDVVLQQLLRLLTFIIS